MATAPISYGSDYSAEQQSIERARKYAELMQQQAMQPVEGNQMAGGWVVPNSPLQGLTKALQGFGAEYKQRQADAKEKALAAKYQSDLADVIKRGTAAQSGTPERTFQTPANEMGDEAAMQRIPATAADPSAAAGIYMSHPATQALGMQLAQQNAQRQQWAQLLGGGPPGPQGAAGGGSPTGGAQAGGMLEGTGLTMQDAQAMLLADPTGKTLTEAVAKARQELFKPHVQPNGQVMQYQRLPDGTMGWAPGKGSVASAQEFANVTSPKDQQAMDQNAMQMYQAKGVDLPGYKNGMRVPQMNPQGIPQGGGYIGPQPNGRFAGDPQAILAQMQNIPDPNERAAAIQALRNQMSGQNPNPQAAAAAGTMQSPGGQASAPSGLAPDQVRATNAQMAEKLNTLAADELFAGAKTSQKAVEQLSAINESRKAIRGGAFQGSGADAKTDIVKFANGVLGLNIDPTQATNSDYLRSTLGSQVLAQAKALGTNPSNTDAKRIEEIVGNLGKDPNAMNQILDWQEAMIRKSVSAHNSNVDQTEKRGYKPPYDLRVTLPETMKIEPPKRRASDAVPVKKYNPATGKIE